MGSIESQAAAAFNAGEVAVECPKCQHKATKTIGWLRANRVLACAGCGETINLDTTGIETNLQAALGKARELDQRLANPIKLTFKL